MLSVRRRRRSVMILFTSSPSPLTKPTRQLYQHTAVYSSSHNPPLCQNFIIIIINVVNHGPSACWSLMLLQSSGSSWFHLPPTMLPLQESGTCYHRLSRHCRHCILSSVHWRWNCFADRTTTHTSGNSSIDTSLLSDIYCGPDVLFETCVAMKFVDDDDDNDDVQNMHSSSALLCWLSLIQTMGCLTLFFLTKINDMTFQPSLILHICLNRCSFLCITPQSRFLSNCTFARIWRHWNFAVVIATKITIKRYVNNKL